ncbi:hypothetical protein [Paenibacillus nuruki]|uniref:hypothetical protein n=1 Tax=Paenibacillus nuruki TaxID=1886670 RepID=UPI002805F565|nr:hypothetical protein [Paenibacillus nuruki]
MSEIVLVVAGVTESLDLPLGGRDFVTKASASLFQNNFTPFAGATWGLWSSGKE